MNVKFWWIASALTIALGSAQAQEFAGACLPTPHVETHDYPGPGVIPTSNNLIRPTGKAVAVQDGQKLIIRGHVYDNRCVPLQGAIVELWQANPYGKWRVISRQDLATPNAMFASAGRTYTGNNGGFEFITEFPGEVQKGWAPHVHLRVVADGMPDFTTAFYFANDARNANDPAFKRLSIESRPRVQLSMQPIHGDVNNGFIGEQDIVLSSKARYRGY